MARTVVQVKDLRMLRRVLARHGVPYKSWGTATPKTLQDLWKEIKQGESLLYLEKGVLVRFVRRVQATVHFVNEGTHLLLHEERQVFANGHVRVRDQRISVSEKRRPNERACAAMQRGIREELSIYLKDPSCLVHKGKETSKPSSSKTYPGLLTSHYVVRYRLDLVPEDFRPEGYIERQKSKTTYFAWKEVV